MEWIFKIFLLLPAGPGWRKIMLHPRVGWTGVARPKNSCQILSVWGGVGWNGFWEILNSSPPVRGGAKNEGGVEQNCLGWTGVGGSLSEILFDKTKIIFCDVRAINIV